MARDRWVELCKKYAVDDGLPVREVGLWTEEKLWFWNGYISITTSAMVGHPKWPEGLTYVDLFAGPGICRLKSSGKRIPGSVLIAANAPKPFRMILAAELDSDSASACEERLKRDAASSTTIHVFQGDCNQNIQVLVEKIPQRSLTLAFIDPEGVDINFDSIAALATARQADLLILFADRMDIVRNVDLYERQQRSVLDRMMGEGSIWRETWKNLHNRTPENICNLFADEFRRQLKQRLGYKVFGEKVMRSANGPLYRLIFASKNPKGLEFWDKVTRRDHGGQHEMF
jgi:three-Cys-motif partner protein